MSNIAHILTRVLNRLGLYTSRQMEEAVDSTDFWRDIYRSDIEKRDEEIRRLNNIIRE